MNKRLARRIAAGIAYRFVQQALDGGGDEVTARGGTEAEQQKIEQELDRIAQRLFERSDLVDSTRVQEKGPDDAR